MWGTDEEDNARRQRVIQKLGTEVKRHFFTLILSTNQKKEKKLTQIKESRLQQQKDKPKTEIL